MPSFPKQKVLKEGRNTSLRGGRTRRTVVALSMVTGMGLILATLGVVTTRRDLRLATGPAGPEQRDWLVAAAERPDLAQFFKGLPHEQRVAMARAIARYDDAPLAKLSGLLLADFDERARAELILGMKRVAAVHPAAVAAQLARTGSFQRLGVFEALRSLGDRAIPPVAEQLSDADARPGAVTYLVEAGTVSIQPLLSHLDDPQPETRLAAAEALGGLRARSAVGPLLRNLGAAPPGERPDYLAILAAIGDPSTQGLFASVLEDPARPLAERTAALVGLGRTGGSDAARLAWRYATSDDPVLAQSAFDALVALGDPSLRVPSVPPRLRVRLAGLIHGSAADGVLRDALTQVDLRLDAVAGAKGRLDLVDPLAALLPQASSDGDLAAALVASLLPSAAGRARLARYAAEPALAGFIQRANTPGSGG